MIQVEVVIMTEYNPNTAQWNFFAWASFAAAGAMNTFGLWHLPVDPWVKGYMAMGVLFLVGATFTLSKTVRDNQEFENRQRRREESRNDGIPMVFGMPETASNGATANV